MTDLADRKCKNCEKDAIALNQNEIKSFLNSVKVEWQLVENGKSIKFFNIDYSGGFVSIVDNQYRGEIHECYVNNIKCYADEARFGGIVVSKVIE